MPDYHYKLRRGDQLIATGHLSREEPLEVGERVTIGSQSRIVRSIEPQLQECEPHRRRATLARRPLCHLRAYSDRQGPGPR